MGCNRCVGIIGYGNVDKGIVGLVDVVLVQGLRQEQGSNSAREEAFGKVVDMLLQQRQIAKANKDWATSDKIRNELAALGFEIKDGKEGATWRLNR